MKSVTSTVGALALAVTSTAIGLAGLTPAEQAWTILEAGVQEKSADKRAHAVQALGLIRANARALELARRALHDVNPQVRTAAAKAMEAMGCEACVPDLKLALSDKEPSVLLAAAHALWSFHDRDAYDVYYAVLTGERKAGKGVVAGGMDTLKDPKKMAQFGIESGIGFIPFAAIGYSAVKEFKKDDTSPVRAGAATVLAGDPDPASAQALVKASSDKSWLVRAAALEAIGRRDDPKLLESVVPALTDERDIVRYAAAAAIVRLSTSPEKPAEKTPPPPGAKKAPKTPDQ